MGEVYRARDPRLGREVAVKVLAPDQRPGDQLRLEREARAAGNLNHPNLLSVFDIGFHLSAPYVVSELLEGESLRERLKSGPLPLRKALDYGAQVARGLAAAHEKGICHRDVKPENLFVTRDGRVKILDFGLAKSTGLKPEGTGPLEIDLSTDSGIVLGTVGYMAPEQAHGLPADHRSDIFALGTVLYEMLSGRRAFQRETAVETLHAIIKEEPPSLLEQSPPVPPLAWRLVRHCLEKDPHERFQSAQDLAFQLQELTEGLTTGGPAPLAARRTRRLWPWLAAAGVLLAGMAGFARLRPAALPHFQQVTFQRGTVFSARFAPDGRTIVYGAAWDGNPVETWLALPGAPESRTLGLAGASLNSVSSSGELAVSLRHRYTGGERWVGTLARVPLAGGAPREMVEEVEGADWSPGGTEMAVVRSGGRIGSSRLEYPTGRLLYRTPGSVASVRVSPTGDRVAFLDDPSGIGISGAVAIVDRQGQKTDLTVRWPSARGLAWSPDGREVWFTAGEPGQRVLRAVDLSGAQRVLIEAPGNLTLRDVSRDGRLLLTQDSERRGIVGLAPGATVERELSWFSRSGLADLSRDGRVVLFADQFRVYVRGTDGSPAVRLGEGNADTLSNDGRWALTTSTTADRISALAVGAGDARALTPHGITGYAGAWWLPGDGRIVFNGRRAGSGLRAYVQGLAEGEPEPVTPEDTVAVGVPPLGDCVAATSQGTGLSLYPLNGGPAVAVGGSEPGDRVSGWAADGRSLWVFRRDEVPARIHRLDLATGRRELWRTVSPADPAGVFSVTNFLVTADGRSYAYSFSRVLSDLYVVEGVR
jgi:eukaryotic-like serine/threonine-protein kinase